MYAFEQSLRGTPEQSVKLAFPQLVEESAHSAAEGAVSGVAPAILSVVKDEIDGGHPWYGVVARSARNGAVGYGAALGGGSVAGAACPET